MSGHLTAVEAPLQPSFPHDITQPLYLAFSRSPCHMQICTEYALCRSHSSEAFRKRQRTCVLRIQNAHNVTCAQSPCRRLESLQDNVTMTIASTLRFYDSLQYTIALYKHSPESKLHVRIVIDSCVYESFSDTSRTPLIFMHESAGNLPLRPKR